MVILGKVTFLVQFLFKFNKFSGFVWINVLFKLVLLLFNKSQNCHILLNLLQSLLKTALLFLLLYKLLFYFFQISLLVKASLFLEMKLLFFELSLLIKKTHLLFVHSSVDFVKILPRVADFFLWFGLFNLFWLFWLFAFERFFGRLWLF